MGELSVEMKSRGLINPFDLTEMDQWVNDATRRDIATIYRTYQGAIFGFKIWGCHKFRGHQLLDAKNFEFDLLIRDKDEYKVDAIVKEQRIQDNAYNYINALFAVAITSLMWV